MGKKSKRNNPKSQSHDAKRPAPANRTTDEETEENLRFEDPFVDEVEDDEVEDEDMEDEAAEHHAGTEIIQSWNPLTHGEPGEELEMDPSAYKMYHSLGPEWPCLSFDFMRDDLGESRSRFPHTLMVAVGTQADRAEHNQVTIMKLSDLGRIPKEEDELGEEYDNDDDEESDDSEDEIDLDPILESFSFSHHGSVNRLRVMPQESDIVATWSDAGTVNLFNAEGIRDQFSGSMARSAPTKKEGPYFSYEGHNVEGYAIDWSKTKRGFLATGDCKGNIHVWTPRPEGGYEVAPSYTAHESKPVEHASVEDLQWSPTEATVFAAAECGGSLSIYDTRAPNRSMLHHKIHSNGADVNVLSWNELVTNLLASGGDDGVLSVWDLRQFSSSPKPLARFTPHRSAITSVDWHPTDESMLAVTDDSGAYIYDLSVEEDDTSADIDVPPQLLFVHCGSQQFKEVHWHPQIKSCLMTTALSGFSIFVPCNL